jgi:beta-lactamase class A
MASFLATTVAAIWAATPVSAAGQLVDMSGQPVAGAIVDLAGAAFSPPGEVRSDMQGRFQIGSRRWPYSLPRLLVQAPGFVPAATTGGRLRLHRWPRLSGRVVDDQGIPLAGAVVAVNRGTDLGAAAMTNLDGRFDMVLHGITGSASLTAARALHDPMSQPLTLALDQIVDVEATLPRQLATLHLDTDPAGLAPLVDGQPPGDCQATPCDVQLLAGAHQVSLATDLYLPWVQDFLLTRNGTVSLRAALQRKTGTLTIVPALPGEVVLDGNQVGTGPWSAKIPTGQHAVSFRSASTWPFLAQANVTWEQTTMVQPTPALVAPGDATAFTGQLQAYLAAQGGGSYGVYLEDLTSGATMGVTDGDRLAAASVIKLPEALYLLKQLDLGQVKMSDLIDLHPEDFMGGTGSLYGTAHSGDKYSYDQLLALLIQQSDNTAWKALDRVFGPSHVDGYAASIGAGDCQQGSGLCSARSAGHLLAQLARGGLLSPTSTQRLLALLENTVFNDRINYYLSGVTVAHKVGMDGGVINDCGVVYLADPFAICVFTTTDDPDRGTQVIRDIARVAVRYYGG